MMKQDPSFRGHRHHLVKGFEVATPVTQIQSDGHLPGFTVISLHGPNLLCSGVKARVVILQLILETASEVWPTHPYLELAGHNGI